MKVLLVDDDVDLIDVTTYALRREGYSVLVANDGQQALSRWEADEPDVVILDAGLPKLNGFEVCRRIRQDSKTPIIMLSAATDEQDKIRGLHLGADDYVTKPFSPKELAARTKAVLRRCQMYSYTHPVSTLALGDLTLDLQSYEVAKAGQLVQLTPLEFRTLHILAMNEGRVVPYSWMLQYAWGYDSGDASLLKTHICHIRRKLGLGDGPGEIRAVSGVGYRLVGFR